MKYEFILKVKEHSQSKFYEKYRSITNQFNPFIKKKMIDYAKRNGFFDYIVLVNELDDDGSFVRVIE